MHTDITDKNNFKKPVAKRPARAWFKKTQNTENKQWDQLISNDWQRGAINNP